MLIHFEIIIFKKRVYVHFQNFFRQIRLFKLMSSIPDLFGMHGTKKCTIHLIYPSHAENILACKVLILKKKT